MLIDQIDLDYWIWPPKNTLAQWAQTQHLQFESHGHPALSAQSPIAGYILDRMA
jgi:hypothetical protein